MADIFTNPVQVLSNTPGAGDWKIPIKITDLNTDESFINIEVLIDGATEGRSLQTCFKADGPSDVRFPVSVPGLLAGQAVVVMVQSLNPADNVADPGGATVSASIQRAAVNVLAVKNVDADTAQTNLLAALEADLIDDETHEAVMAAIITKLATSFPDLDDLTLTAIAATTRDAILDASDAIDGKTPRQVLQILAAIWAGKASGAGSGTETFKGLNGETTRAIVTADEDGNRTNVEYPE